MKRFFLLATAILVSMAVSAQQPHTVYCAIWGTSTTSIMGRAYIDYGQGSSTNNWLVDESGKAMRYTTIIEVLNYLSAYGWKLETSHTLLSNDTGSRRALILSKEISSKEEITEGILTRQLYNEQRVE